MNVTSEKLIAHDNRRTALLAAAEKIDFETDATRIAMLNAREQRDRAVEANESQARVHELNAHYFHLVRLLDRLMIEQGAAWSLLDQHDAARADELGVPHISIYDRQKGKH